MTITSEQSSSQSLLSLALNNPQAVDDLLEKMYQQIQLKIKDYEDNDIVFIGIHTGGFWVAERLYKKLALSNPLGSLNISFYRDDFTKIGLHPEVKPSQLPVALDDKHIILVDDVLFTGRTVRAALNEIFDYGRPASVTLAVLLDRGGRELPVYADIIGQKVTLEAGKKIKLCGPKPLKLVQNTCS